MLGLYDEPQVEPATIPGALRVAAARFGDRPAYVEAAETLTFADLLDRVRAVAGRYVALGLQPGERVVLWAPNSTAWVVAGLAVSYAGGVLVPANSRYTGHEVADLVERTKARLVIVADGFLGRTQIADLRAASALASVSAILDLTRGFERAAPPPPQPPETGTLEPPRGLETGAAPPPQPPETGTLEPPRGLETAAPPPPQPQTSPQPSGSAGPVVEEGGARLETTAAEVEARADAVTPDDVADILFTSGTTGRSKGVLSAHRQSVGVARAWGAIGGIRADDRYLVVNPFFHSFGYKAGILVGLLTGAALYPMATFDPTVLMRTIQDEQITVLPGAPAIFQAMLPEHALYDLSSLRLAVTGAASVPVVLIERMRNDLGIEKVVTAFGMTEAVVVTMCRGDESPEIIASTNGRAIEGMETRIAEDGELLVRGEFVMQGYLDDPEATAEAIDAEGWLHTGDIATLDDHGNMAITDRKKDMYISGGFNVYPAEVEQVIARVPGVVEAAVVGVPDERLGEVGLAYVVGTVDPDTILTHCRERLANFKIPREVQVIDALPRNLSGKVLKTELRGDNHE